MRQLDLHGYFHHEVEDIVENFVLMNHQNLPIRIITGYSDIMKKKVSDILEKYNYIFYTPAHNGGEIIIINDKEGIYLK